MQILSKTESVNWCKSNGIRLNKNGLPFLNRDELSYFSIPVDTGQKIATVKNHFEQFKDEKEILLWITEWGVFPSSERMHIFDRFRASYGEKRPLIEAPGHIFKNSEFEDALSATTIAVLFFWDCYVLNDNGTKVLFYSHDEEGYINKSSSSSELG